MNRCVELFELVSSPGDFPLVFVTKELGDAARVREAIEGALPDVRWSEGRGAMAAPSGTIVLWRDGDGVIDQGPVDRVVVLVDEGGDPSSVVSSLCGMHGWTACDSELKLLGRDGEALSFEPRTIWSWTARAPEMDNLE